MKGNTIGWISPEELVTFIINHCEHCNRFSISSCRGRKKWLSYHCTFLVGNGIQIHYDIFQERFTKHLPYYRTIFHPIIKIIKCNALYFNFTHHYLLTCREALFTTISFTGLYVTVFIRLS